MPDIENAGCPFCGQRDMQIKALGSLDDVYRVDCSHCGNYKITDEAVELTKSMQPNDRSFLAAYNCHHRLQHPKTTLIYYRDQPDEPQENIRVVDEVLKSWWPKHIWDRLDVVLLNIFMKAGPKPGHELTVDVKDYPFCFGEDGQAGFFILDRLHESGVIHMNPAEGNPRRVKISLSGFRKIEELQRGIKQKDSKKVFVAMSFDDSLNSLYDNAIKPAVEACGYDAYRIDRKEHNEKICDKIEATIRQSRFIVADFTQNKHGVYYEAGLARGLGLQIIWCVKESEIESLHFDTRQYNHIIWNDEADMRRRLEDRIRAMGL